MQKYFGLSRGYCATTHKKMLLINEILHRDGCNLARCLVVEFPLTGLQCNTYPRSPKMSM